MDQRVGVGPAMKGRRHSLVSKPMVVSLPTAPQAVDATQ